MARTHRKLLAESGTSREYSLPISMTLAEMSRVLIRNAMYLFVHHISALLVMFINALLDPDSKSEMRDELLVSFDVFSETLSNRHRLVKRGAIKGFCVVGEIIRVGVNQGISKISSYPFAQAS